MAGNLKRAHLAVRLGLTPKQLRVVQLAADGMGVKQIAFELGVTQGSIKQYLQAIYRKIGMYGVAKMCTWYIRQTESERAAVLILVELRRMIRRLEKALGGMSGPNKATD